MWIVSLNPQGSHLDYYYLLLTDEDIETQNGYEACSNPRGNEARRETRQSDSGALALCHYPTLLYVAEHSHSR